MRGKRAKIIRKAARLVWDDLDPQVKKRTSPRRLYRAMKKQYTAGNLN